MEDNKEKDLEAEAQVEDTRVKDEVEKKIRKEIEKKQEKQETLGVYRIASYLKEEHKWENYLFVVVALITLVLGMLVLSGALAIKEDVWFIGEHSTLFGWLLVGISSLALIYALYPFYKPCFGEFKKITWLTMPKFLANSIRVLLFMLIFVGLFLLYDAFIADIMLLVFNI